MQQYYFDHSAFDNYPVVGISWDAADAFTQWRTYWLNQNLYLNGTLGQSGGGLFGGLFGGDDPLGGA